MSNIILGYEAYFAVICALICTYCGYQLGKSSGFHNGVHSMVGFLIAIKVIKVKIVEGKEILTLSDGRKLDELKFKL